MVSVELVSVVTIALVIGGPIGYYLAKHNKLPTKFMKSEAKKQKVINDPDLLCKKLNESQKIVDVGEVVKYSVEEKDGVRKVVETREEFKAPKEDKIKKVNEKNGKTNTKKTKKSQGS